MMRLYPPCRPTGLSFVGVKRMTVPNQSMSLREIIRRFIRRESLPLSKDGTYEERFEDLEKLSHQDITVRMDRVEDLKVKLDAMAKRINAKAAADEALRNPPPAPPPPAPAPPA